MLLLLFFEAVFVDGVTRERKLENRSDQTIVGEHLTRSTKLLRLEPIEHIICLIVSLVKDKVDARKIFQIEFQLSTFNFQRRIEMPDNKKRKK